MSDKLVNIITCDNMKADVVLLADGKISVMEFSQMHKKIEKLEAINKKLITLLRDIDEELSRAQADALETGNMTGSSLPAKLRVRLFAEIQKAKGEN